MHNLLSSGIYAATCGGISSSLSLAILPPDPTLYYDLPKLLNLLLRNRMVSYMHPTIKKGNLQLLMQLPEVQLYIAMCTMSKSMSWASSSVTLPGAL